jgi:peptide/nickel transport system ATP-binding protein
MRLVEPASGRVVLDGVDLVPLSRRELAPHRRRIQMIFQDPYASLNPRQTVMQILEFALSVQGVAAGQERRRRIETIVDAVGLPSTALQRYAHEFSGGQRQRIGIARALVIEPELVICDEPVSALDVSVQAQILNLLVDLKAELSLSMLFISHDLAVVRYIADRVLVMNAGRIVERGAHDEIWSAPAHPYTRSLIASVPGRRHEQDASAARFA